MKHLTSRALAVVGAALLGLGAVAGCQVMTDPDLPDPTAPVDPSATGESARTTVLHVLDGDTVVVAPVDDVLPPNDDSGHHTVRLLGIDAPEMNRDGGLPECGAEDATDSLQLMLPVGTEVIIAFDPRADATDQYGRSLAYVTNEDLDDIGLAQVQLGFATPWYPEGEPEPMKTGQYREAVTGARADSAGAWAECGQVGRG